MGRAHRVVILILVVFSIIRLACAAEKITPTAGTSGEDDGDDYLIIPAPTRKRTGPTAAPVPPPPGALDSTATGAAAPTPAAAFSLHNFSAVAVPSSAALAAVVYF